MHTLQLYVVMRPLASYEAAGLMSTLKKASFSIQGSMFKIHTQIVYQSTNMRPQLSLLKFQSHIFTCQISELKSQSPNFWAQISDSKFLSPNLNVWDSILWPCCSKACILKYDIPSGGVRGRVCLHWHTHMSTQCKFAQANAQTFQDP